MAFTTMHFGVGMACGGAIALGGCLVTRRGWRVIPWAMTLGGIWACVPDMPRLWREDFPSLPFAAVLGTTDMEARLLSDWFFFHKSLDAQPREFALHGLALILLLYNVALALQAYMRRRTPKEQQTRSATLVSRLRGRLDILLARWHVHGDAAAAAYDRADARSSHLARRHDEAAPA